MVGLAELGCEHLHLAGVESTLVRGKRRPCGNALGPRGQLCIGRNDAKLLLSCENTAAGLIPAHVETAAVACDPLRCRLVRRMDGRSEEHTSELQSLMRISYAVFCLKKKN